MLRPSLPVEGSEGFDAIEVVGDGGCLAATMHGEEGIAHIDASDGQRGGEDVAEGAATGYVAVVHEALARNAGLLAETGEDGC